MGKCTSMCELQSSCTLSVKLCTYLKYPVRLAKCRIRCCLGTPKLLYFISLAMQFFVKITNRCPATSFGLDSFILWNTRIRNHWVHYYRNITCCQLVHIYVISMRCTSSLLSCLWTHIHEYSMKCRIAIDSFHIGKYMLWLEWHHIQWQSSGYFMFSSDLTFQHFVWGQSCWVAGRQQDFQVAQISTCK